ncbi:MAG: NUDIX hydrolase [Patescibacteria group bacterium]|jgi:ADP-ribose pyrophosphatase YjhB (NUDIX family)
MELQVGVKILLKNPEGKFLLTRRNPKKYPEVGPKWDIVGGRIDPGTPLLDNLRREVKEETGMDYTGDPTLVAAQDILRVPGRHVVRLTYIGDIEGDPQLSDESLEYKWFTREELVQNEDLDIYVKELLEKGTL